MTPRRILQPRGWLVAWLAIAFGVGVATEVAGWGAIWGGLLLIPVLADAWRVRRIPAPEIRRALPEQLSLNRLVKVRLWLRTGSELGGRAELIDALPPDFAPPAWLQCGLQANSEHHLSYAFTPRRRGELRLSACWLRVMSPWRFWWYGWVLPAESVCRVYPDFARVADYRLAAMAQHRPQLGIRLRPRRGQGSDFHQLRDYREGDTLRQIDWNATSRRARLISREYQEERDQQLILMLDSGRRMRLQDDELSFFDRCLNGLLMLSDVALREGDAVAMMSFAEERRILPTVKGRNGLSRVLDHFHDLYPSGHAADYVGAAAELMTRFRKRALVVMATSLRDEDLDEVLAARRLLASHHRVLIADLREPLLDRLRHEPIVDFAGARLQVGVQETLHRRERLHRTLQAEGIDILDCAPQALTAALVNRYLAIKRAGQL